MAILEVQHEQLTHTAYFSRPAFDLWGNGKVILNGVYDAFRQLGANASSIKVEGTSPTDQHVTVALGTMTHVFRFDRVETTFINPYEDLFQKIPGLLINSLAWVRAACPDLSVAAHQITHLTHSKLTGETLEQVLKRIGPSAPRSGGDSQGHGAIFHWNVPEYQWVTQLTIDRSLGVANGLFVMLSISIPLDKIDFVQLSTEGRAYLVRLLSELDIKVPAFE